MFDHDGEDWWSLTSASPPWCKVIRRGHILPILRRKRSGGPFHRSRSRRMRRMRCAPSQVHCVNVAPLWLFLDFFWSMWMWLLIIIVHTQLLLDDDSWGDYLSMNQSSAIIVQSHSTATAHIWRAPSRPRQPPSRTAPWNPSVGHRAWWSWVNSLERSQQHSDRRLTIGGSSQWIIGWLPVEWSITPVWKVKIAILHYSMDWFKGKFTGKPHI